jgi:nucleoside-diphosphate-sugar epimerase
MIDIKKRIFITWVTGFVWANLLHRLISVGANDVHVLIRKNSDTSRIDRLLDNVTIHSFSLENKEETVEFLRKIKPQIVYHIAAMGTVVWRKPVSIDDLIVTNTLGSIHLIDASIEVGCEYFVNTWSSSEYWFKDVPMFESDIASPNNFYGISKVSATQYASLVKQHSFYPIVTYRLFSVYGQFEDPKRLIPTLIKNYIQWNEPELSSPLFVRDFVYIDDVVDSYLNADIACDSTESIINIWSWIQSSISDVINILKDILNSSIEPQYNKQQAYQFEPKTWVSNNSKMKNLLQISPISLRDGLMRTIDHFNRK